MTCGFTLPRWDRMFEGATPCDLPERHEGPHRSVLDAHGIGAVEWEQPDPSCDCADCLHGEDPMDACVSWGRAQEGQSPADLTDQPTGQTGEAGQPHEGTAP